ncbi:hypothetical protein [Halogeometricum pallidum]|nr:hypothetical protein [Halogeometricum pallidum]
MVSNPVSFFGFVLLMLTLVYVALWVYRDAGRRGNAPLPWAMSI